MQDTPLLREFWTRAALTPLRLAAALFALFAALRFYSYFGGQEFQSLPLVASFLAMWFTPSVFLSPSGARRIGLVRPRGLLWIPVALLAGASLAYACYLIGYLLFGYTDNNWFMSVGYTYLSDQRFPQLSQFAAFSVFTIPALVFSPVGEELFFRGILLESIRERCAASSANLASAGLFAALHLVHHGIVRLGDSYKFLWISGLLWFALMLASSLVFSALRHRFGSIWVSVLAHAAFNLTMNVTIFFSLFVHP